MSAGCWPRSLSSSCWIPRNQRRDPGSPPRRRHHTIEPPVRAQQWRAAGIQHGRYRGLDTADRRARAEIAHLDRSELHRRASSPSRASRCWNARGTGAPSSPTRPGRYCGSAAPPVASRGRRVSRCPARPMRALPEPSTGHFSGSRARPPMDRRLIRAACRSKALAPETLVAYAINGEPISPSARRAAACGSWHRATPARLGRNG